MPVTREAEKRLKYLHRTIRAVAVISPRQNGIISNMAAGKLHIVAAIAGKFN